MENAYPKCPKCDSGKVVKNGFTGPITRVQRYQCRACRYQFTRQAKVVRGKPGKPQEDKTIALVLYLLGYSMPVVGGFVDVSTQTISRWLKEHGLHKKMCIRGIKTEKQMKVEKLYQSSVKSYFGVNVPSFR